jgi:hypothetical protein
MLHRNRQQARHCGQSRVGEVCQPKTQKRRLPMIPEASFFNELTPGIYSHGGSLLSA